MSKIGRRLLSFQNLPTCPLLPQLYCITFFLHGEASECGIWWILNTNHQLMLATRASICLEQLLVRYGNEHSWALGSDQHYKPLTLLLVHAITRGSKEEEVKMVFQQIDISYLVSQINRFALVPSNLLTSLRIYLPNFISPLINTPSHCQLSFWKKKEKAGSWASQSIGISSS